MKIPRPDSMFRQVIRLNRRSYTVTRVTFTRGERGSNNEELDEQFEQLIWVFRPSEQGMQNEFGIRQEGDIHALAIPSQYESDTNKAFRMELNDRIEHGGETYSVSEKPRPLPNHEDEEIILLHFDKMENA